ncbi:SLOG family protein [Streptosporangium canum]|uniref:SLOG family protein n=1 Tax=Streptosporangium canum TaxID=324952 RepID=UPI00343AE7AB
MTSPLPAPRPFRILVTGSRTWTDELVLGEALMNALPDVIESCGEYVIVHGACPRGADLMASRFCENEAGWLDNAGAALIEERHPADWDRLGKRAGFVRNAEMVALGADVCLAFIVDGSRGASHTADLAEKAGIPVRRYERTTRA